MVGVDLATGAIIAAGTAGAGLATAAVIFGIRKLIEIGQFSYHNARLATVGNPYVRKDEIYPLLETDDPQSIGQAINSDLDPGTSLMSFREVDRSLMVSFHKIATELESSSPAAIKPFVRAYIAKFEAEELKRLIRLISIRKEPLFPVGWITDDIERHILSSKDLFGALEVLEGQPVAKVLSGSLKKEEPIDMNKVDMVLERYYLDRLENVEGVGMSTRRGINAFYQILTDRYNIHSILRGKKMGSTRDEIITILNKNAGTIGLPILEQMIDSSGIRDALSALNGTHLEPFFKDLDGTSLTEIETRLDDMILEGSIGLSHSFSSNVGPTIRYLISKEMELRNLRTVFQASFSGWTSDRARKMLVTEGGY